MYDHERSLVKKLADKPFAIIGVNSDQDLDQIRETVKEKNLTWRSFQNSPKGSEPPISEQWQIDGWPTIYVLDGEGKIRYINPQRTANGEAALDDAITTLLAELGHEVDLSSLDEESSEEVAEEEVATDAEAPVDEAVESEAE